MSALHFLFEHNDMAAACLAILMLGILFLMRLSVEISANKREKELREKEVNIHFIEQNLDTKNRKNDLLLGTLIGEAVFRLAIERGEVKIIE